METQEPQPQGQANPTPTEAQQNFDAVDRRQQMADRRDRLLAKRAERMHRIYGSYNRDIASSSSTDAQPPGQSQAPQRPTTQPAVAPGAPAPTQTIVAEPIPSPDPSPAAGDGPHSEGPPTNTQSAKSQAPSQPAQKQGSSVGAAEVVQPLGAQPTLPKRGTARGRGRAGGRGGRTAGPVGRVDFEAGERIYQELGHDVAAKVHAQRAARQQRTVDMYSKMPFLIVLLHCMGLAAAFLEAPSLLCIVGLLVVASQLYPALMIDTWSLLAQQLTVQLAILTSLTLCLLVVRGQTLKWLHRLHVSVLDVQASFLVSMVGRVPQARSLLTSAWALWKLGGYLLASVTTFLVTEAALTLVRHKEQLLQSLSALEEATSITATTHEVVAEYPEMQETMSVEL